MMSSRGVASSSSRGNRSTCIPILLLAVLALASFESVYSSSSSSSFQEISLTSSESYQWTLRECDDGEVKQFPASVPGNVHTDLMSAGLLEGDPYYRYNEVNMSWVTTKCWQYELQIPLQTLKAALYASGGETLHLRAAGLDNVATVYVNDVALGSTSNSFRTFYFPIDYTELARSLTSSDSVRLSVRLSPVSTEARNRAEDYPYEVPATENWNVWAEPSSRNFVRKAGSDFGKWAMNSCCKRWMC
jgi:beta-mannosidase